MCSILHISNIVVFRPSHLSEWPGELVIPQIPGPHPPRVSDSLGLRWGLKICILTSYQVMLILLVRELYSEKQWSSTKFPRQNFCDSVSWNVGMDSYRKTINSQIILDCATYGSILLEILTYWNTNNRHI